MKDTKSNNVGTRKVKKQITYHMIATSHVVEPSTIQTKIDFGPWMTKRNG